MGTVEVIFPRNIASATVSDAGSEVKHLLSSPELSLTGVTRAEQEAVQHQAVEALAGVTIVARRATEDLGVVLSEAMDAPYAQPPQPARF